MVLVIMGVLIVSSVSLQASEPEKIQTAVASAEKWLSIVDEGKYGESWEHAAEYFRNAINQEKWTQSLKAVREPLGKLISRTVTRITYETALPGAPDGEYVVIQFSTSLERKKTAMETVTPMLDKDGTWRVSGYYIK